ncbi:ACP S-malonyltransferase [Fructilactobacillus vespulae]|uniref:ACP S-malonyltransferase n=1 Tax=Fructilactobacillus vespulae TaxID=1249630 RepID=UPI0039B4A2B2
MKKIGYLFSGQGSQFEKMGQDLYASEPTYRQVIDEASSVLDLDLADESVMDDPKNVQVAILAMSYGIYCTVKNQFPKAQAMLGLSLGEYGALVASGALDFKTALLLVRDRSQYMAEAGAANPGSMAAVLKLAPEKVAAVCAEIAGVYPANYNTATQTVIGGETSSVQTAITTLKEAGAKRVVPLKVAVASHTPLMQSASDKLATRLQDVNFSEFTIPVISNTTGRQFEKDSVKATLRDQLIKPTHFATDLEYLNDQFEVDTLIEIGPGDTLSRFAKKTLKGINTYQVDSVASLNQVQEMMKEED